MPSPWIVNATHDDFVVAAKPAGVSFHNDGETPGFVTRLRAETGLADLHPVHRLDRITSGLVLLARNADAARELGELFESGRIEKYYVALSERRPSKSQGRIQGGMEKGRGGSWKFVREGGQLAVTQFFSFTLATGLRLFVVRPRTGRTHQIRVALKSLGAPILGDSRYGGTMADRGYLHAWALRFEWRGTTCQFMLPPDEGSAFTHIETLEALRAHSPFDLPWPRWHAPRPVQ
ncbi:MAG: TIGR01621 family pseudouridine synthase [Rhodocyclaceae bacterium]